jgi:hypothetical protein
MTDPRWKMREWTVNNKLKTFPPFTFQKPPILSLYSSNNFLRNERQGKRALLHIKTSQTKPKLNHYKQIICKRCSGVGVLIVSNGEFIPELG